MSSPPVVGSPWLNIESSQVRDIIINRGLTEAELRVLVREWRQQEGPLADKINELAQELGIAKSATPEFLPHPR